MRSQFTCRMPDDLRSQLEVAARKRGRNLTDELLGRLRGSFAREREHERNPTTRALGYLISAMAELHAGSASKYSRLPKRPWTRDPFLFRSFKLAVAQLLDALEPPGDPQAFDSKPIVTSGDMLPFDTPEDMADFASKELLWAVSLDARTTQSIRRMISDDDVEQDLYAIEDARRDLGIEESKSSEQGD
jgi:hypothetical protein